MGREVRGDVGREVAKLFLVGGIGQGEIKFSGGGNRAGSEKKISEGGIGRGEKIFLRGGNRAGKIFFSELHP